MAFAIHQHQPAAAVLPCDLIQLLRAAACQRNVDGRHPQCVPIRFGTLNIAVVEQHAVGHPQRRLVRNRFGGFGQYLRLIMLLFGRRNLAAPEHNRRHHKIIAQRCGFGLGCGASGQKKEEGGHWFFHVVHSRYKNKAWWWKQECRLLLGFGRNNKLLIFN